MTNLRTTTVTVPSPLEASLPLAPVLVTMAAADAGVFFAGLMHWVDFGWFAGLIAGVTITGTTVYKKMKRSLATPDTDEVNRILSAYFQSDITVDSSRHRDPLWEKYFVQDGDGGSYWISTEFDRKLSADESYNGTITVSHIPGDLGLGEFDKMLTSMSKNPDVKAVAARIANTPVTAKSI